MPERLLVTVGTDGYTNWVKTPDGQRFNLGTISVLKFISKLTPARLAREAVEQFNAEGEALVSVDADRMWELFTPRRSRWAHGPFMPNLSMRQDQRMTTDFEFHLSRVEGDLNRLAKAGSDKRASSTADLVAKLRESAALLSSSTLASEEILESNLALADEILVKAAKTCGKIDRLRSAGKRFNAVRAKSDVYAVTSKVASILSQADMRFAWTTKDLEQLAERGEHLYALFAGTRE